MEQPEGRDDVHVFTGPGVPQVFADAYAVNADGTLKIWRWSTRQQPKRHPIAEYAPGMWTSYEHRGEQGDEAVEQKQSEPPRAERPRRARPAPRYKDEDELIAAQEEHFRQITGHPVGDEPNTDTPQQPWTPDPVADREAEIRSREPGAPEKLRLAVVRPSLPPRDFAVPTHQLPRRTPSVVNDVTEVLPALRPEQPQQPQRQTGRANRRGRTRGSWRSGGAWLMLAVTALSAVAAIH